MTFFLIQERHDDASIVSLRDAPCNKLLPVLAYAMAAVSGRSLTRVTASLRSADTGDSFRSTSPRRKSPITIYPSGCRPIRIQNSPGRQCRTYTRYKNKKEYFLLTHEKCSFNRGIYWNKNDPGSGSIFQIFPAFLSSCKKKKTTTNKKKNRSAKEPRQSLSTSLKLFFILFIYPFAYLYSYANGIKIRSSFAGVFCIPLGRTPRILPVLARSVFSADAGDKLLY